MATWPFLLVHRLWYNVFLLLIKLIGNWYIVPASNWYLIVSRRGSKVVMHRSAKPIYGGSIPPRASNLYARVAKLADAQDLKSWGTLKAHAGSSPAPGTDSHIGCYKHKLEIGAVPTSNRESNSFIN